MADEDTKPEASSEPSKESTPAGAGSGSPEGAEKPKPELKKAPAAKPADKPAPKPSPKKPATDAGKGKKGEVSRRGFLHLVSGMVTWTFTAWAAFWSSMALGMVGTVRFMFPNVLFEDPLTVNIGSLDLFSEDGVYENFKDKFGFWIVRRGTILYALSTTCTHLGCIPNWLPIAKKFKCPCHGSGFYITGIHFEGPAPRPLERFKITVATNGNLVVDKASIYLQGKGQWTDPNSFIPV